MTSDDTVKLSLTELNSGKIQARIDQSPAGASKWPAHEFEWPDKEGEWFRLFMDTWQKPNRPKKQPTGEQFGRQLYDLVFDGNIRSRFDPLIEGARAKGGNLRLALNLAGQNLSRIPFELLHDSHNFLMFGGARIVRIFDELSGPSPSFGPFRRLLFILAEPEGYDEWGHDEYLAGLETAIKAIGGIQLTTIEHATPKQVLAALKEPGKGTRLLDAIHIIAHGEASSQSDAVLLLEDGRGGSAPLPAHVLAQALKNQIGCFVYLNSCSTALAMGDNPFAGYAQRLMRDGACGTVFAMQKPISIRQARSIAESFFAELSRGKSAEIAAHGAVTASTTPTDWGIPCLYTRLSPPEQERRDRIAAFFSADPNTSTFAFYLPVFRMGYFEEDYQVLVDRDQLAIAPKIYNYKGATSARSDILPAAGLMRLIAEMLPPGRSADTVTILRAADFTEGKASHSFLFGTKSQESVEALLEWRSNDFAFEDTGKFWQIRDLKKRKLYKVDDPSKSKPRRGRGSTKQPKHYAVIEKIVDSENDRVFFVVAGLWDQGTQGAGEYLLKNWERLVEQYGASRFQVLLEFAAGLNSLGVKVIRQSGA